MPHPPPESPEPGSFVHPRWARTEGDDAFFLDEDGLKRWFALLLGCGSALLGLLAAGLWKLQSAALAPPVIVGVARGLVFTSPAGDLSSVRDADFDPQLSDTVEVLFGRTEKGLPPEIAQFCEPEVVAAVGRAYGNAGGRYPAGFVQTLALLEARQIESRPGFRRMTYRGLLSSRSLSAAQSSPIYLDCTFEIRDPTPLNAAGWRLVRLDALSRDDFYRPERETAARRLLRQASGGSP